MINKEELKELLLDNEALSNLNANYRSYCQDLADFYTPNKAWINSIKIQGERVKFNFLYDSTAILASREAANGFATYQTNPATTWFALRYRRKDFRDRPDVKKFCYDVADWSLSTLKDTNFYSVMPDWFHDKIIFGTGTFSMLKDDKKFAQFTAIPVAQVNRVIDANGELVGLYRNFTLTARQAWKMWGHKAGESVVKSYIEKPNENFDFVHYVGERENVEPGKVDALNMPYKSVWIGKKDKNIILESGFMDIPYYSEVFYKDSTDPNGFSPAMDMFPWVKLVNAMARTVIRGGMKQIDPPYIMADKGIVLPLNLNPAGMNYRNAKLNGDSLQVLPVGNGRIDLGRELIELYMSKIERGMFVDLFRSFNEITKQMTVPEVQQRIAQGMAMLGPVVNRDNKTLARMVTNLINMGVRNKLSGFPKIPEELIEENYDFIHLSQLSKAQNQSELGEIQGFLQDVAGLGAIIPSAFDKIDEDKTIDVMHRVRGVTPEVLREDEAIDRMRRHREEQNALIAQLQAGQAVGDIAKTGSEANKNFATVEAAGKA
jgi:hypothetical protein